MATLLTLQLLAQTVALEAGLNTRLVLFLALAVVFLLLVLVLLHATSEPPTDEPAKKDGPRPVSRPGEAAALEVAAAPKAKPEPKVEAKPEPKVEAKVEPKVEAKPEPKVEAKVEPKVEAKPEPKVEAKVEPKVEAKPAPKPKPELKVEAKPKPEPKVEAKPKPEPKVEAKPEPKVEAKPEPKVEAKPEPKPEPKAEAKVDGEKETRQAYPAVESAPAVKPGEPRREKDTSEALAVGAAKGGEAAEASAAAPVIRKVLLVEDSNTMRRIVTMVLAGEPYEVTAVETGSEAVAQARSLKPDIVIADLSLDDKDGYQICQELRADGDLGQVPVLLLHGPAAPLDSAKAKEVGATDDLPKPFPSAELLEKLKALSM